MIEITNKGNLPKPLQIMAKEVQGVRSTLFYECINADELLQHASDGKCEETTVIVDKTNNKGYITAFSFKDSQIEDLSGDKLIQMYVYFAALDETDTIKYKKMLHTHRNEQEDSHSKWKNKHNKGKSNA